MEIFFKWGNFSVVFFRENTWQRNGRLSVQEAAARAALVAFKFNRRQRCCALPLPATANSAGRAAPLLSEHQLQVPSTSQPEPSLLPEVHALTSPEIIY